MEKKVSFSDDFKSIIKNCLESKAHLGSGNPDAKVLIVGQESALEVREQWYDDNALNWQNKVINGLNPISYWSKKEFSQGHTWSKYQKLHDYIYPEHRSGEHINFEERFFTTEMSDNPAKKSSIARKNDFFGIDMLNRKSTFFKEDFIQGFPVVVLACSDYIKNNNEIREIDEMFKVTYAGDEKENVLSIVKEIGFIYTIMRIGQNW